MGKYKLVVFANPVEGREAEFNDWYSNRHLHEVVATPGFETATRYRLTHVVKGEPDARYLAIYDMSDDAPLRTLDALQAAAVSGAMYIDPALDQDRVSCAIFEQCSPMVSAT